MNQYLKLSQRNTSYIQLYCYCFSKELLSLFTKKQILFLSTKICIFTQRFFPQPYLSMLKKILPFKYKIESVWIYMYIHFSTVINSSHGVLTYTVVITSISPSLSLGVLFALVYTHSCNIHNTKYNS